MLLWLSKGILIYCVYCLEILIQTYITGRIIDNRGEKMDKVVEILSNLKSGVDFNTATRIVTDKIIDSIDIATMISDLEDTFDIEIGMEYMENENFDSAQAIWAMIQEIQED